MINSKMTVKIYHLMEKCLYHWDTALPETTLDEILHSGPDLVADWY